MKRQNMQCKLCLQNKNLLKQSHIIPNFLYKELLKKDGFFVEGNLKKISSKVLQTGVFDRHILCAECDNNLLSKLESYAYQVLYDIQKVKGASLAHEINQHGVEWAIARGVDYKTFKLFLLSLIWRFSISKQPIFAGVNLGSHEDKMRKMIFENDAGDPLDYSCAISSYRHHADLPFQIISQPLKHRNELGGNCYSILINGLLFTFNISKNLTPDYISEIAINKNNELKVIRMPKDSSVKIIRKYMKLPVCI